MGKRRSLFKAPSMDEQAEGSALSRRNAQIVLFAVGFVFPFGMLDPTISFCKFILLRFKRKEKVE